MLQAYWEALQNRVTVEQEFVAAVHGIDLRKGSDKIGKDEAKDYINDPLKDFPYDVDYSHFDGTFLAFKEKEYAQFCKQHNRVPNDEEGLRLWSPNRVRAFSGTDAIAKRASVRGELWLVFLEMSKRKQVTLPELRCVLAADMEFLKLMPSQSELVEYGIKPEDARTEHGVEVIHEIPAAHVAKLIKEGRFPSEFKKYVSYSTT